METIFDFGSVKNCIKCGIDFTNRGISKVYDEKLNILIGRCPECGVKWKEKCADGTKPILPEDEPTPTKIYILERNFEFDLVSVVEGQDPLYGRGSWKIYSGPYDSIKEAAEDMNSTIDGIKMISRRYHEPEP